MKNILFILLISVSGLFSQEPCKKISLKACINHESWLHIKNGVLTWEQREGEAPGTHKECGTVGIPRVNGKIWKVWNVPYKLDFNTNGLNVEPRVLVKKDISEITQVPSAANGWETIWHFFDPSDLPHNYSMSFVFCPPGISSKPKETTSNVKKDSIKPAKAEVKVVEEKLKENIVCNVYFESGKNIISKPSVAELEKVCNKLNKHNLQIEISGFKADGLKLYEDRSVTINNFLLSKGIEQHRIKYIGFGDNEKKIVADKKIKCFIVIN